MNNPLQADYVFIKTEVKLKHFIEKPFANAVFTHFCVPEIQTNCKKIKSKTSKSKKIKEKRRKSKHCFGELK